MRLIFFYFSPRSSQMGICAKNADYATIRIRSFVWKRDMHRGENPVLESEDHMQPYFSCLPLRRCDYPRIIGDPAQRTSVGFPLSCHCLPSTCCDGDESKRARSTQRAAKHAEDRHRPAEGSLAQGSR
jgi:hypothetical protein